ncbi:MAG: FecR domain-containing protein [Opitutaceae bacterium]|nr:FecR domain-containing protein [Opitutaceae bacterium]
MNRNPKAGDVSDAEVKHAAAEWKARIDAGLSPEEEGQLQEWCEADIRHRKALERFDAVWQRFDRPFQAGAADLLLEELQERSARRRRQRKGAVFGVALTLVLGTVWLWRAPPAAREGRTAPAVAILRVPARQVLEDGSVVELREDAEIATDFRANVRRVTLLRGEAHFQVVRNPARPFQVHARGVLAEAVGTSFTVDLRSRQVVEVLVTSGKVAVSNAAAESSTETTAADTPSANRREVALLDKGKSCVVEKSDTSADDLTVVAIPDEELEARLSWRAPRVEFTKATLAEAIAVLNRYAEENARPGARPRRFVIDDDSLRDVQVSGLFRVDRVDIFVSLLENGFGISAQQDNPEEIRLRREPR